MPPLWMKCSASWRKMQREDIRAMSVFLSMIKKETLHLIRDSRTMTVVLVMPIVLLLLFGFAISTEVNNVNVVAVINKHDDTSRNIIEKLRTNSYFTFKGIVAFEDVETMLRRGEVDAAVILKSENGKTDYQIIADASNTSMAQTATGYVESVLTDGAKPPVLMRTLYNPQLKSAYNFVPGIMGMIFILICAMMTSVSIVSEKETGTMNLLLVSPVKPRTIILGKLVPYFILSCIILTLTLIIAYAVLGLPVSLNILNVIWVSVIYIILALALGLLISTLVNTQVTALLVSGVLFMLPVVMLSGMIFPIEDMPVALQWFSCIIPARWFVSAMRTLMIQQLPASFVMTQVAVLSAMTLVVLFFAIKKFNTKH